jgi:hypothetical protein
MLNDVTVIAWGEFGRTPQINKDTGRDHWPKVSCAIMAGGGMTTGQVIGVTNRWGEFAEQLPVHFLGIDCYSVQQSGHRPGLKTDRRSSWPTTNTRRKWNYPRVNLTVIP